jgi:alkanesulfonate monooxygenase SsuD/methylene tetrahydromethanopterin reductase-like flavin-dependent oxidoreductase (luciferase family)
MMNRIGRERGWPPIGRGQFEMGRSPRGALLVGSPEEVAEKILLEHEFFGHDRFMAQISIGALPHERVMHAIELFGTQVAPAVRKEIARRSTADAEGS